MSNSSGVSYLRDNGVTQISQDAEATSRIQKISSLCSKHFIEMLQNMFDGIDDSFFELANNARTNNEQNLFFEAMREIRIKRKSIEQKLEDSIEALFSPEHVLATESKTNICAPEFETLAIIAKDDMEEDVAITSMSSKAVSNFQGPLLQFQTRMANLFGQTKPENINAPLNPKDISKAFAEACAILEINLKERLIVYKQFDRYVLSNLGYILDEANKFLIKAGILPDFKSSIVKHKHQPRGESASTPIPGRETSSNFNSQTENLLPQLQTLLANIRTQPAEHSGIAGNSHSNAAHAAQHYIKTEDLVALLSAMQTNTVSKPNEQAKVVDIHAYLKSQFQQNPELKDKQPALKQLDEDLINLVSMLFEFILEDYNLAAPIQVLISRLQIPILKVVIKDASFFNSHKHPARKLLNTLAKAGIGWNENPNPQQDTLYQKIQETVQTILNNHDGSTQLFDQLNKEFEAFMLKEEKKSKIVEQRTKESEKGLLRSKQAQKAVDTFLAEILTEKEDNLPDIILETLKQGWSRVMFLSYLKDDQEHQWLKTCQIAQDLVWCMQPLHSQKDRQHWIVTAPKLLKELKSGLQDVSYHTNTLEETLLAIRSSLTQAFKNNNFDSEDNSSSFKSASSIINAQFTHSAVERQLALNNSEIEKYIHLIDELPLGTWVEFKLHTKKLRCKLSTKLDEADICIFVNRMGLKSLEKTKEELANDLLKKNAIILEQGMIFDRAMSKITSSLKLKASA